MPYSPQLPPWARIALVALAVLAVARGVLLVHHEPLLALANNYDQIRYSACLDLAPWRPGVQADRANPPAPYSRFAFQRLPRNTCIWTSDLLFTAPVALVWRIAEAFGGRPIHSIRRLADMRLLACHVGDAVLSARAARRSRAGASGRLSAHPDGPGEHALSSDALCGSGRRVRLVRVPGRAHCGVCSPDP
jgi:hypothetical protein